MYDESESGEIKLGDVVEGQTLVGVGIDFTFTEIIDSHQTAFKTLDEWLTGIRTYDLEDSFDTDAILWDELEDCGYEIGEEDSTEDNKKVKLYDVWVDQNDTGSVLNRVQDRLDELKKKAISLIPAGLQAAAQANPTPASLLKLLVQTSEPE
ncbi:MAG: hypothetical protein EXS20_04850 [Opitutales bacterium]|nr:hypothetical protein [Opitutales bacterium]